MLETSRDILLVALALSALGLTGYLCYLIYSLAKLIQEAKKTVEDINKKLDKVNPVLDSATMTVNSLLETIEAINENLLKPVVNFSSLVKRIRNAIAIFKKSKK